MTGTRVWLGAELIVPHSVAAVRRVAWQALFDMKCAKPSAQPTHSVSCRNRLQPGTERPVQGWPLEHRLS